MRWWTRRHPQAVEPLRAALLLTVVRFPPGVFLSRCRAETCLLPPGIGAAAVPSKLSSNFSAKKNEMAHPTCVIWRAQSY